MKSPHPEEEKSLKLRKELEAGGEVFPRGSESGKTQNMNVKRVFKLEPKES